MKRERERERVRNIQTDIKRQTDREREKRERERFEVKYGWSTTNKMCEEVLSSFMRVSIQASNC
jgi:hypothetical protein